MFLLSVLMSNININIMDYWVVVIWKTTRTNKKDTYYEYV